MPLWEKIAALQVEAGAGAEPAQMQGEVSRRKPEGTDISQMLLASWCKAPVVHRG